MCITPKTLYNTLDPQICIFIICKILPCLQFLDSPSITVADHVYCQLLSPLLLFVSSMSLYVSFIIFLFLVISFRQSPWSHDLTEINVPTFYIPSSISDLPALILLIASLIICWSLLSLSIFVYGFSLFLLTSFVLKRSLTRYRIEGESRHSLFPCIPLHLLQTSKISHQLIRCLPLSRAEVTCTSKWNHSVSEIGKHLWKWPNPTHHSN